MHISRKSEQLRGERCPKEDSYPLSTQDGVKYVTSGFTKNRNPTALPRPGLELNDTGRRSEILSIRVGGSFRASGGVNPCTSLPNAD